ncbi:hypothetical protein GCM10009834_27670 [Streptomonospora arabica]
MTTSIPSSSWFSSLSVIRQATSISASFSRSSPVISQSIHTKQSFIRASLSRFTVRPTRCARPAAAGNPARAVAQRVRRCAVRERKRVREGAARRPDGGARPGRGAADPHLRNPVEGGAPRGHR